MWDVPAGSVAIDDKDLLKSAYRSPCLGCAHYLAGRTCAAFPIEIPDDIWEGISAHALSREGDGGITFKPNKRIATVELEQVALPGLEMWRPRRAYESKVEFALIDDRINKAAAAFYVGSAGILQRMRDKAIRDAMLIRNPYEWAELGAVSLGFTGQYRNYLRDYMNSLYQFARGTTAQEVGTPAPITSQAFLSWLDCKTRSLVEAQASRLTNLVRGSILASAAPPDYPGAIARVFDDFAAHELARGGDLLATLAVQAGRQDAAGEAGDAVYCIVWSALLDKRTCQVCRDLDGTNWRPGDPSIIYAPLHWSCRCLHVYVMRDDPHRPPITGLPPTFSLPASMQLFVDTIGGYRGAT